MAELTAKLDMSAAGNTRLGVHQGWAAPEKAHRWTLGRESRVVLPIGRQAGDLVLVISATPCLHPPALTAQTIMLAIDDRLLATVHITEMQSLAFRLPAGIIGSRPVLSFVHLSSFLPRAASQIRHGQPLGLAVHHIRLFRLSDADDAPRDRKSTAQVPSAELAGLFESLGQGCQFGLVQRECGADPLGLLRFVDTMTALLVEGLLAGFAHVDDPDRLELHHTADEQPRYRWHQRTYGLLYDTRILVSDAEPDTVRRQQVDRLAFLRRKFLEDLQDAQKIFVLTRIKPLTEPEALAVLCALRIHGPATLLWTVPSAASQAGRVERLAPGFLRGHLGPSDRHGYGAHAAWLDVMRATLVLMSEAAA